MPLWLIDQAWTADPRFADAESRRQNTTVLDEYLASWTTAREAHEIMGLLQGQHIPCAQVLTPWTVFDNPQLQGVGSLRRYTILKLARISTLASPGSSRALPGVSGWPPRV